MSELPEISFVIAVYNKADILPHLIRALAEITDVGTVELEKEYGETKVAGQGRLDRPPWHWPAR